MNVPPEIVGDRVQQVRAAFDRSFAQPPQRRTSDGEELLAVRAGGRAYALRLPETAGLFPDRPVTALPGPVPALVGVAGFSGTVVPVYDLGALLGHPGGDTPRWLVLAAGTPPLALACDEMEGQLRVPLGAVVAEPAERRATSRLGAMVILPDGARPVVDVPALRAAVHALIRPDQNSGTGDPHA